jgi:hypothetical protein
MSRLGGAGAVAQLIADIPLSVKVTPSVKKIECCTLTLNP